MSRISDAILHPFKTTSELFSRESMADREEEMKKQEAQETADELCNIDSLINVDLDEEMAKLDFYKSKQGVEIDPALYTFLKAQQKAISTAKTEVNTLKNSFISKSESIRNQEGYLKTQKETLSLKQKAVKEAKKSKMTSCSPLEYFLNYGKGKGAKNELNRAKEALTKARQQKAKYLSKINLLKSDLDGIKTKITEAKAPLENVNKTMNLYHQRTDNQFALVDEYLAVGAIAKQTGLATGIKDGDNASKLALQAIGGNEADNLLEILENFPLTEKDSQEKLVISLTSPLTHNSTQLMQDVRKATKALETLNLSYTKNDKGLIELLGPDDEEPNAKPLLSGIRTAVKNQRDRVIDSKKALKEGKLPELEQEQDQDQEQEQEQDQDENER
jgi:hypothetical protein